VFLLATRFVRLAQYIVCSSHQNLYDVIARRSVRKIKGSNGNSGIYCRGISTAGVWLGWLRYLLALASPAASVPFPDVLTRRPLAPVTRDAHSGRLCSLADALPRRRALDSQRIRPCGLRKASPFSD